MKRYGQIIETYIFDGEPRLTIWDLEERCQKDAPNNGMQSISLGDVVTFNPSLCDFVSGVEKIERDSLPDGISLLL